MKQPAGSVTLSSEEGAALIAQVRQSHVPRADAGTVEQIIRMYCWLVCALQDAKRSGKRRRTLLFGTSSGPSPGPEASSVPPQADGDEPSASAVLEAEAEVAATAEQAPPGAAQKPEQDKPTGGHRPGTGRLGAGADAGATRAQCGHEELAVGLRCSACGEIVTAGLPAEASADKYRAQARAVLAVSRYDLGIPGYRLQGYQAMLGIPVPAATQWDQIEVVGDCAYKVCAQMEREAAQGELIFQDDTAVRILSLSQENRELFAQAQG